MKAEGKMTKEHVPQKCIGGKGLVKTCDTCNNTAGVNIDNILYYGLCRIIESKENIILKERTMQMEHNSKEVNAIVTPTGNDKEVSLKILGKMNHPESMDTISNLSEGNVLNLSAKNKLIDEDRFSAAIIKNAYLALFARFGYTFLMDAHYDKIREMVSNPDYKGIPELYTRQDVDAEDGVYQSEVEFKGKKLRFYVVVMPYSLANRREGKIVVALPTPKTNLNLLFDYLKQIQKGDKLKLSPTCDDDLIDESRIRKNLAWAYGRKL